jgi:nitroreductase
LRRRWSPRAFSERPIEPETVGSLLEAARWAASSRNEQPWRFLLAQRGEVEFTRLVACLMEGNQPWAGRAPLLILVCACSKIAVDSSPNRCAVHDCGLAVGNMTVQATAMDLWMHQMGGFSKEKARETFAIPADFEPVSVLAIGYAGDAAQLPEARRAQETAPRTRKALGQIAFKGGWGVAYE